MKPTQCTLEYWSQDWHLSQIYTGFALLDAAGRISLTQRCIPWTGPDYSKSPHLRNARATHLRVVINRGMRLYYDVHDGPEIDEEAAEQSNFYFKRSHHAGHIPDRLSGKVLPLGLNYALCKDGLDRFELELVLALQPTIGSRLGVLARLAAGGLRMESMARGWRPTLSRMHSPIHPQGPVRLLFMARTWDPDDPPDRDPWQREERAKINEMRARCVMLLRKEFGGAFTGGFKHTEYAVQNYREALLPDAATASKAAYIGLLTSHAVCIATTGLHGSIGWKFGEYMAFSKAIVSERLNFLVPGGLAHGRHYLEFQTPEECVEKCLVLFRDAELRRRMMEANRSYYQEYLRPDQMIARTLDAAARGAAPGS